MSDSEQELFLIEFLVSKVNIPSIRAMHDEFLPTTTCVSFQILSLPPVSIEQASNSKDCSCEGEDSQIFNKGKSCLFALPTIVLQKPITSFPIIMSVYKKLPPGVLPDVMLIGTHQIQAKDLINTVLKKRIFKSSAPSMTSKAVKKITTATGQAVGEVEVFMRISCFGKKIITQFQIPRNKKPFLFKGELDSPVIQCKKIPSEMEFREPETPKCICKPVETGRSFGAGEADEICCPAPPSSPVNFKSCLKPTSMNQKRNCPELSKGYSTPGNVGFTENFPTISDRRGRNSCRPNFGGYELNNVNENLQRNESSLRKCGCTVKMEKRCGCSWKS